MLVTIRDCRHSKKDRQWIQDVYGEYMEALSDLTTGLFSVLGADSPREDEIFANWFASDQSHPLLILKGTDPENRTQVRRFLVDACQVMSTQPDRRQTIGFEFVRTLAGELSSGDVDIPAFPDIAVRVRRVLADPASSTEQVVRVVGSEPALAARLMRISNSASFNRSGRTITDLRTAINRIGYTMVRSASIAFAMAQIRNANQLAGLEPYLRDLWQRSTLVAAFAYVLARSCTGINPDEALLGGMMHGIGKFYVLTRAADHPELFANRTTLDQIINDWHASIGKAILENWEFSEEMAQAIGSQDDPGRTGPGAPDLRDVIALSLMLAPQVANAAGPQTPFLELPAARRLGLDAAKLEIVMLDCAEEVAALSSALGG